MKNVLIHCAKTAVVIGCMLFPVFNQIKAQTAAENLQNGVEIYNAMREYMDDLRSGTLTSDQLQDVKNRMDKGVALMDKVIRDGNADEIKTARYFRSNFIYEYIFTLGMKGENRQAFDLSKEIDRQMTAYTASDFPLRYSFFGKNYVIKWEDFAPTQAEYYTGRAEIAYNIGEYEDAMGYLKLALSHPNTTDWLKYIAVNKMLDLYAKNNTYLTEAEYYDFAVKSISAYNTLSADSKKTVADNKYPTDKRGITAVLDNTVKNVPAAMERSGAAALAATPGDANEKVLQLFELTYKNKQTVDASFHSAAEAYARKSFNTIPTKSTIVGILATDRMAAAANMFDCNSLTVIIDNYTYWKETTKAGIYAKKKEECIARQIKEQQKAARRARRANSRFNVYTGVYLFPLLKSDTKRDYGAVLNLAGKKTAWEFSYMRINNNKENVQDLTLRGVDANQDDISRWNGYYAHVQPKFMTAKGPAYIGVLLGYAEKNFISLPAQVTADVGPTTFETFNPSVKQYILMTNFGGLLLTRGFGIDTYFGIGATFSQWDYGNSVDNASHFIDNIVLEERKDNYFGLIMRLGITMGINFGRGNMR